MQSWHPCHVDPVDVNLQAGPPQHANDHLPVCLLDTLLKDNLIRKSHSANAWMSSSKETGPSGHLLVFVCLYLDGKNLKRFCFFQSTFFKWCDVRWFVTELENLDFHDTGLLSAEQLSPDWRHACVFDWRIAHHMQVRETHYSPGRCASWLDVLGWGELPPVMANIN